MFHFLVIELVEGDLLEDVWQRMSDEEQRSVVAGLVEVLKKLHSGRPSDKAVKYILGNTLCGEGDEVLDGFEQPDVFECPIRDF